MFPERLKKSSVENILSLTGEETQVSKTNILFKKWEGEQIKDDYNKKAVLDFDGEPVFAEIAILRIFQNEGWDGVWIDSYRRRYLNGYWGNQPDVLLPDDKQQILNNIRKVAGAFGGCWDVFCWKEDKVIFAEAKRRKKDKITISQIRWLKAALNYGLETDSFLIVEWDLA
jgi:hypothetical protein